MKIVTWNVGKTNPNNALLHLCWLGEKLGGGIIVGFQEVDAWTDMVVPGWEVFSAPECHTALCIPTCFGHLLCSEVLHDVCVSAAVMCDRFAILTVYMPDVSKGLFEYLVCLEKVTSMIIRMRARGAVDFIILGDLNIHLPELPNISS